MIGPCYAIRIAALIGLIELVRQAICFEDFESIGFTGLNLTWYLTTINSVQSHEGMRTNGTVQVILVECLNVDTLRKNPRVIGLKGSQDPAFHCWVQTREQG